ncbi:RNA polymerase sigma-70 factor [uncultured Alistipes sp.]|uniref:RNA polymerase sigma-70 factor n=1 Tax=uncultured Alistipes sp. TaxID=538949 RepID=UPI0025D52D55|nr:RNA polymerase sigma-70 factor [uncultured Alistipes sp.]
MKNSIYNSFVTSNSPQEQELLARLIRGDIAGYEILFHKYYPTFFAFIKGMTRETAVAEDIAQNIFMKVWVNREKLDQTKSIRNYLYVLAKHEIYNYFRTKNRTFTSLKEAITLTESKGAGAPPVRNEIEEKLDLAETAEMVETIVEKMPPQRQQIFRMSRFEHIPSREIAEQLNLSVRTVEKHLELALKELRKYLNIIPAIIIFLDILP